MPRDPEQLFIVSALTRKGIADDLNDHLGIMGFEESIEEDDDRLTDEFCKEYAAKLGEIDFEGMSEDCRVDAEMAHKTAFLEKLGINTDSPEDTDES